MALTPTSDETMLAEAVNALLDRSAPVEAFRALRDDGGDMRFRRELWDEMAAMGLPSVVADFGLAGAALVMEAIGRHLAASPLASAIIARDILARAGLADPVLICAVALAEGASFVRHADGTVTGRTGPIPDLREADRVLVAADGAVLLLDPSSHGLSRSAIELIDHRDYAVLNCERASPVIVAEGDAASVLITRAQDVGTLLSAAELLGLAQECFERTVDYLKTREQFGVLIGTFQALQHRAARLWIDLQLASAVLAKAARAMDEGSAEASQLVSHAKLRLTETASKVIDEAVQMHGGIGVTDDLDIGLFMKRARVLGEFYGDVYFHSERLARERFGLE